MVVPRSCWSRAATALAALAAAMLTPSGGASASELFGGVLAHDVDLPLSSNIGESGVALQAGWRGGRIAALGFIGRPSPHAFVSVNSAGDTSFVAAGLSWRLGDRFYLRPGIGLAVHDGPSRRERAGRRSDLGSRLLFEPELSAGVRLNDRLSAEVSWVHVSHAQLFGRQNPGLDTIGLRLAWRLD